MPPLSRRQALRAGTALGIGLRLTGRQWLASPALAAGRTLTIADVGVGDPGGDWSKFQEPTGNEVNLVSIGNAPSAVVNQLIAGGGQGTFDVINIVGGMQKPLVENDLILELETGRLSNWPGNSYIKQYLAPATPKFQFIGYEDKIYGVPTVLQGNSFAYLPEETGELNSYAALFDPRFKGFVALEDNYTTAGQKTALYLKHSGQAEIADPADMTPEEVKTVIDFMIEHKKAGQFRVIWSSIEQAVNLITSKEVQIGDEQRVVVLDRRAQKEGPAIVDEQLQARKEARVVVEQSFRAGFARRDVAVVVEHAEGVAVLEGARTPLLQRGGCRNVELHRGCRR